MYHQQIYDQIEQKPHHPRLKMSVINSQFIHSQASPSLSKIKTLAESINQIQSNSKIDVEQHNRAIEQRVTQLDDKLKKNQQSDKQKFMLLGDQYTKLHQAFNAEKSSRELMTQRKTKEIELVAAGLEQSFENEKNLREEMKIRLFRSLEEKTNQTKNDVDKQSGERTVTGEHVMGFMKEQVTGVIVQMQRDREETDTRYNQLTAELDRQCQDIRELLIRECQEREEQESQFKDTFTKVCGMLQQRMNTEKEKREETENKLLELLEEVCLKIGQEAQM